jgi:hypothetical protein
MAFVDNFVAMMAEQGISIDPSVVPDPETIDGALNNIQSWREQLNPAVREGFDEGSEEFAVCFVLADPEINVAPELRGILESFDQVAGRRLSDLLQIARDILISSQSVDGGGDGGGLTVPISQPTLQFGDSGPDVTRIQEDLAAVGCFSDIPDGSFGQRTMDAVILFQSTVGLIADGVVNEDTWSALEGPEASVEGLIDIADLPGLALVVSHASDETVDAYLADLGIDLD